MIVLIWLISALSRLITMAVLIDIVLSFFMDPFHPVRRFFDSVTEPMLRPIRQFIPPMAGFDFSPMILIIIVQILEQVLVNMIVAIA